MTPAKVIEDTPTGAAAEDLQYVKVSRKPAPPPPSNGLYSADGRHENDWYNQSFGDYHVSEHPLAAKRKIRIIAVGAGASGLQLAYKFERQLEDAELQIYERNADVGGTWLENRYPGCECDIPSHSYQFRWARNPSWSKLCVAKGSSDPGTIADVQTAIREAQRFGSTSRMSPPDMIWRNTSSFSTLSKWPGGMARRENGS